MRALACSGSLGIHRMLDGDAMGACIEIVPTQPIGTCGTLLPVAAKPPHLFAATSNCAFTTKARSPTLANESMRVTWVAVRAAR